MIVTEDIDRNGTRYIRITECDLTEEFEVTLLAQSDNDSLKVEHGCIVIRAVNGTWWYQIEDFTFNGRNVVAELVKYER